MPTLTSADDRGPPSERGDASIDDFDGFLAAATLLRRPRLARSYVYVCYFGPVTIRELLDALGTPRATVYDDVERLESLGVIERDQSTRPHTLTAPPFAFVDEGSVAITPTLLHAVALGEIDDDVAYFCDRYGIARLARALRVAGRHHAGGLTQRMAAEELAVSPAEGMAIVRALRPALAAGAEHDPYLERLLPEIDSAIEIDGEFLLPAAESPDGDE
jgi:hypothetical protein